METNYAAKAEAYYTLLGEKNLEGVKKYLHADVEFFGPLAALKGKQAVVEANNNFMKMFNSLKIKTKFGGENQAVVFYEVDIPGIATNFPGVSLLSFKDGLITKIELFYDGTPFSSKKRDEIFVTQK